jgi:hypothetical protein
VAASRAGAEEQKGGGNGEEGGGSGRAHTKREGGGLVRRGIHLACVARGPRASSVEQSREPADSAERRVTEKKKGLQVG